MAILTRLIDTLQFAKQVVHRDSQQSIFTVFVPDDGPPDLNEHASLAALGDYLLAVRTQQDSDPEGDYYLYIFSGNRWRLQKGPTWKLFDGEHVHELQYTAPETIFADDDGSLRTPRELPEPDLTQTEEAAAEVVDAVAGVPISDEFLSPE